MGETMIVVGVLILLTCVFYVLRAEYNRIEILKQYSGRDKDNLRIVNKFIIYKTLPNKYGIRVTEIMQRRNVVQIKSTDVEDWTDVSWQ